VNQEKIERLLARADEAAGEPAFALATAAGIRRRIHRERLVTMAVPTTVAAGIVLGATLWVVCLPTGRPQPQPQRIASLEEQVRQLRAQTEATLKLLQEVLETDRRERRLASLEAEFASIPDPIREIERQVDKAAFILVYQADKVYQELNESESAVRAYREVIQFFPTSPWAQVARERLARIEQQRIHDTKRQEGANLWDARNT